MSKIDFTKSGTKVDLKDYDPNYAGEATKDSAKQTILKLQAKMQELQERLYAGKAVFAEMIVYSELWTQAARTAQSKSF